MNRKLTDKDKKDWQNFIKSKEKIYNKDIFQKKELINEIFVKKIDLHGYSLENANKTIRELIKKSFSENIKKLVVITGKGLRSKNKKNPYVSKDLSILKYSVPDFIKSDSDLMKLIKEIKEADNEHGGSGAFNIFLKNSKE